MNTIPCKNCITFAICKNVYNNAIDQKYTRQEKNNMPVETRVLLLNRRRAGRTSLYKKCDLIMDWYYPIGSTKIQDKKREIIQSLFYERYLK